MNSDYAIRAAWKGARGIPCAEEAAAGEVRAAGRSVVLRSYLEPERSVVEREERRAVVRAKVVIGRGHRDRCVDFVPMLIAALGIREDDIAVLGRDLAIRAKGQLANDIQSTTGPGRRIPRERRRVTELLSVD